MSGVLLTRDVYQGPGPGKTVHCGGTIHRFIASIHVCYVSFLLK